MSGLTLVPAQVCAWLCGPPQGPSTPFATPELIVYDTLRVVAIAAATGAAVAAVLMVMRPAGVAGQRIRVLASMGLLVAALTVEVEHFGDYANWRLIVILVSSMAMAWGNYAALRYERPPEQTWRGQT